MLIVQYEAGLVNAASTYYLIIPAGYELQNTIHKYATGSCYTHISDIRLILIMYPLQKMYQPQKTDG